MKFNPKLKSDLAKFYEHIIIVEGKKDISALKSLGFQKVYAIHETGKSIRERAEDIAKIAGKKEKVCILTDFDKRGKELYFQLKTIFQELGTKTDSTLRGLILLSKVSHVEGLSKFIEKVDKIG